MGSVIAPGAVPLQGCRPGRPKEAETFHPLSFCIPYPGAGKMQEHPPPPGCPYLGSQRGITLNPAHASSPTFSLVHTHTRLISFPHSTLLPRDLNPFRERKGKVSFGIRSESPLLGSHLRDRQEKGQPGRADRAAHAPWRHPSLRPGV